MAGGPTGRKTQVQYHYLVQDASQTFQNSSNIFGVVSAWLTDAHKERDPRRPKQAFAKVGVSVSSPSGGGVGAVTSPLRHGMTATNGKFSSYYSAVKHSLHRSIGACAEQLDPPGQATPRVWY